MTRSSGPALRIRFGGDSDMLLEVRGREAWALLALMNAGARGCTPIDTPGPRWSAYVYGLRQLGVQIQTIREKHAGAFPGEHARYVLRSQIEIVECRTAAA